MKGPLRIPAEWERHEACWLAFPYLREEWPDHLLDAQRSIAALCRTIAEVGNEPVRLLVRDETITDLARSLIGASCGIDYVTAEYGDCWLRDTAPLLGHTAAGALGALGLRFNGWGGKFDIPGDDEIGPWLTSKLDAERFESDLILEGGALEFDGEGTFLTTASCVLNDNRNPGLTREGAEQALGAVLSIDRLIWLERGLSSDHTDGHVDMIVRFIAPRTVLCMRPEAGDPNADVLVTIESTLRQKGLNVLTLPAPGRVFGPDGNPLPASYCNFYLANDAVIVPTYGVDQDEDVLQEIANAFSGREVIGLSGLDLLWGGGAFHCVTQPQPAIP